MKTMILALALAIAPINYEFFGHYAFYPLHWLGIVEIAYVENDHG